MTEPVKNILFFGYSDVGHACLTALLDGGENVVGVYTHEDAVGETLWFPSTATAARSRGVLVSTVETLASAAEREKVAALKPELILSCYYRNLIPASIFSLAQLGAFNMHGSLLPRYRGRAPVNWAVLNGEQETGATLHVMTERADAGDIVDQQAVPIGPDDTAADVQTRVTSAAVTILRRSLPALKTGLAPRRAQDASLATKYGRRRPEDGRIDFSRSTTEIHNLVRAVTHPYPGAYGQRGANKIFIWRTRRPSGHEPRLTPGEFGLAEGRFFVGTGDGRALEILRAQEEGGPELDGPEFGRSWMVGHTKGTL